MAASPATTSSSPAPARPRAPRASAPSPCPRTRPGLSIAERLDTIAPHPLARLRFEDCRIPASNRIGEPGAGFKIAMATLDVFRSTVGAAALGFARRALDVTLERARTRKLFGAPLADMQLTQTALAEMATAIDTSALLVYRAAWTSDAGAPRITREAAMAKMVATESAQGVIDRAVQLHGGEGVRSGSVPETLYREIRALRIYEGATRGPEADHRPPTPVAASLRSRTDARAPATSTPSSSTTCRRRDLMPDFINLDRLGYREHLNARPNWSTGMSRKGAASGPRFCAPGVRWTYADLARTIDRMANVLTGEARSAFPATACCLRSANNPTKVALYMAIIKAGGIVVATMPLLRARELIQVLDKAKIGLALCDAALAEEMEKAAGAAARRPRIVTWSGTAGGELGATAGRCRRTGSRPSPSRADDPCLLGFTSGTTGLPKATIHTHRDLLVICDCYAREVLQP